MSPSVCVAHPVLRSVTAIQAATKDIADVPVTFMAVGQKREALLRLAVVESQLAAVRLRLMAASDDVALAEGARDVAAVLAHHARRDPSASRRELALAQALDRRWTQVAEALGRGDLSVEQAHVIVRALDELPADEVDGDVVVRGEAHLVGEARHHGPRELRTLGRKILEVVAPEEHERAEALALAREEEQARAATSLTMSRLGNGCTRLVITVPDLAAERLHTYLEAFTSPRHHRLDGGEEGRLPAYRRLGQAFCSLLETIDPRRLPVHGGDATTLIITTNLAELRSELGIAESAGGGRLAAAEVRRLACTARIVPMVLGGKSEILDLGRASRLFQPAQRKAMVVRDRECRAEGCSIPASWCEAHHWRQPWSQGGRTDLDDGLLLCSWHHHRAHDARYRTDRLPGGQLRFVRRE